MKGSLTRSHNKVLNPSPHLFIWFLPSLPKGFFILDIQKKCELLYFVSLPNTPSFLEKQKCCVTFIHLNIFCVTAPSLPLVPSLSCQEPKKSAAPVKSCWFKASAPVLTKPVPRFPSVPWSPCLPKGPEVASVHTQEMESGFGSSFAFKALCFCQPQAWDKGGRRGILWILKRECREKIYVGPQGSAFE